MSYESAFSGETYTIRTPCPRRSGSTARRSIPHRNAASVFPDPVGAHISVLAPDAIAGQPRSWAGVGASNEASNQRLTSSLNRARGVDSAVVDATVLNPSML